MKLCLTLILGPILYISKTHISLMEKAFGSVKSRTLQGRVHCFICILITVALKFYPFLLLGFIPHIPQLHISLTDEAFGSIFKLFYISDMKPGDFDSEYISIMANDLLPTPALNRNYMNQIR